MSLDAKTADDRRSGGCECSKRRVLPATVIGLGIVSLFTDVSSEAIVPLLPVFLVSSLGASKTFVGAVEGVAELVSSFLKYGSGVLADRRARLKPMVLVGYGVSTIMRPLMGFAVVPWQALAVRLFDRVGKGVRTSPRDALIAGTADPTILGRAFGFHRAMDHAGAAIGTIVSAGLLWLLVTRMGKSQADAMRTIFLLAAIPGVAAMIALALTPEPEHASHAGTMRCETPLPLPGLKPMLVAVVLFAFANATDFFLLLKLNEIRPVAALAPLLWLTLHMVKASVSTAGGRLADRFGRRNLLTAGWIVYALTWGTIGFADSVAALFALTAVYGISHGLVEGAEKALIAEYAGGRRGLTFGKYNLSVGLATMAGNIAFGAVWDAWGSMIAFAGSASIAVLAVITLRKFVVPPHSPATIAGRVY